MGEVTVVGRLSRSSRVVGADGSYLVNDLDDCGNGLDLFLLTDMALRGLYARAGLSRPTKEI